MDLFTYILKLVQSPNSAKHFLRSVRFSQRRTMSSAYARPEPFNIFYQMWLLLFRLSTPSRYTLNHKGESTPPWGTPVLHLIVSPWKSMLFVWSRRTIISTKCFSTSDVTLYLSICINFARSTESYAFLRSMNNMYFDFFSFCWIKVINLAKLRCVPLCLLKPT